ncbi:p18 [Soybean leaf crinkle mottle virus]|nr:p18 [Soybean leaf crinkle mottle virus]
MQVSDFKPHIVATKDDYEIVVSVDATTYLLVFNRDVLKHPNFKLPVLCFESLWIYEDNVVVDKHDSISELNRAIHEIDGWISLKRVTQLIYDVNSCLEVITTAYKRCEILKVRYQSQLTAFIILDHDASTIGAPIENTMVKLGNGFLGANSNLAEVINLYPSTKVMFCVI